MTTSAGEAPRGELTVRLIAMPKDTNANGDIFGGWVISQMDQAGGIRAVEKAQGRVVTVAIDAMTFIRPVKVGDVLSVYTAVDKIGRSSLKIHIEAWAQRFRNSSSGESDRRDLYLRRDWSRRAAAAGRAVGLKRDLPEETVAASGRALAERRMTRSTRRAS